MSKYFCENPNCNNEIPEPQYCCNGFDCGCQGLPIDPPFCSNECYEAYLKEKRNESK